VSPYFPLYLYELEDLILQGSEAECSRVVLHMLNALVLVPYWLVGGRRERRARVLLSKQLLEVFEFLIYDGLVKLQDGGEL